MVSKYCSLDQDKLFRKSLQLGELGSIYFSEYSLTWYAFYVIFTFNISKKLSQKELLYSLFVNPSKFALSGSP